MGSKRLDPAIIARQTVYPGIRYPHPATKHSKIKAAP